MRLQKQKDQSVQCSIENNLTDSSNNGNIKATASTKKNEHLEPVRKNDTHSKFYS